MVPPPTITSFAPTSGPVGTSVTISGANFTGATAVRFNTLSASFTVTSATAIQATVPVGATTGPVSRSEEHTSELQSRSDIVCRLLLDKNFAPTSGPAGTIVTINGANFT